MQIDRIVLGLDITIIAAAGTRESARFTRGGWAYCVLVAVVACGSNEQPATAIDSRKPDGASGTFTVQAGMSGRATDAGSASTFVGGAGTTNGGVGAAAMSGTGGLQGLAGSAGAVGVAQHSGVCSDTDLPASPTDYATALQYATKGTASGDNGTFDDHCDADGLLVEYMCAQNLGCNAPPGGDCAPRNRPTGQVINQRVDCKGWCTDGACRVPCPKLNDELSVVLRTDLQLYELTSKAGPSYLCARDNACPLLPGGPQVLTVTSPPGGAMPTESCLMLFGNDPAPFQLSDGCKYFACTAEPKTRR